MSARSAILVVLWAWVWAASAQDRAPAIEAVVRELEAGEQAVRILCFGDSITGVYYHSGSRRAWSDMLGLALRKAYPKARLEMINAGVSGNTTSAGLRRMDRDVLARKPHLVVAMFGMNDVVRVPAQEFARNLAEIADRCARANSAVMFCTPNNVIENPQRPNAKLAEYSDIVRQAAAARGWPLVDVFSDYEAQKKADPTEWSLLMSETIHPNLNGHRRFAELIASRLSRREIFLTDTDVPPAPDPLAITLGRLQAGQPVKIVAMPPYDRIVPGIIKARHPQAMLEVFPWPIGERWDEAARSASKGLAKTIRDMRPHLVVLAPPPAMITQSDGEAFLGDAQWMLNLAFPFAKKDWDVIAVMPSVTQVDTPLDPLRVRSLHSMIRGKDLAPVQRHAGDPRSPEDILGALFQAAP